MAKPARTNAARHATSAFLSVNCTGAHFRLTQA